MLKSLLRLWSRPATRTLPIFGVLGTVGAVALTVELIERRGPSPADAAPVEIAQRDALGASREAVGAKREPAGAQRDLVGAHREPVAAGVHRDPLGAQAAVADGSIVKDLAKEEPAAQILVPLEGSRATQDPEQPDQPRQQLAALPREDEISRPGATGAFKRPPPLDLAAQTSTPADGSALKRVIELYRKGDMKGGDAAAASKSGSC